MEAWGKEEIQRIGWEGDEPAPHNEQCELADPPSQHRGWAMIAPKKWMEERMEVYEEEQKEEKFVS
jgi:hypothetical protein